MPPVTGSTRRPRVLVLSSATVGRKMLGAAIRPYELTRALARDNDVVLAMPHAPDEGPVDVRWTVFAHQDPATLRPLLARADAVVAQPQWPAVTRELARSGKRLIFDLYVPEPFELLEAHAGKRPSVRAGWQALALDRLDDALRVGHHLVCASERQRDLWIGLLLGARVLRPPIYDRDPDLRAMIDVVALGVPVEPPRAISGRGMRAALPQLGPQQEIVLWNGGIWSWLDAASAIEAMALLRERRPSARLVFMGRGSHEAGRRTAADAEALARRLGLLGETVFLHDGWVPYEERASWLLEADCAVSCHVDHLETRFSVRTRLMDCLWAGLPVVCTSGDDLAARVAGDDLGVVVPERDPAAIAAGLERVLDRGRRAYEPALARAAAEYSWSRVVAPITAWVADDRLPPRLGATRRPLHAARDAAYLGARAALNAVGLRRWPQ